VIDCVEQVGADGIDFDRVAQPCGECGDDRLGPCDMGEQPLLLLPGGFESR
jgi:hypothetical protein